MIASRVVLDRDARVGGLVVEPGGTLVFDPSRAITLESTGNVVVRGALEMSPDPANHHVLAFREVDEDAFVGGGLEVLETDVGLWVMGAGRLRLAGTRKLAWTRASGSIPAGARAITLEDAPDGWTVGDEIVLGPTRAADHEDHASSFDTAMIDSIDGRVIVLDRATSFEHPTVAVGRGLTFAAEVLNLSRTVRIEGQPGRRAHVFIRSSRPQVIRHAGFRHLGPRQPDPEGTTAFVVGRYGLHFHHAHDGSRGSLVEGAVVRDCGNHAFVPHMSHGITFRSCIAYEVLEDAYWWDLGDETHDTVWDRCVASAVRADPAFRGFTLTGFLLGRGRGNVARGCVAFGVQGNVTASGFMWPPRQHPLDEGVWTFRDCLAHDNRVLGIYAWQNTDTRHVIERFVGFHNGRAGILHGAYINPYSYRACTLYGNRDADLEVFALKGGTAPDLPSFEDVVFDGAGFHDFEVVTGDHALSSAIPVLFRRCEFRGYRRAGFSISSAPDGSMPDYVRLEDCAYEGNEFWIERAAHPDVAVEVDDEAHGSILLRRFDQPGRFVPRWNASVT